MIISSQETPNPNSLQFLADNIHFSDEPIFLKKHDDEEKSPFAKRLFEINGITAVMFGNDFITVTKDPFFHWGNLEPLIRETINDAIEEGIVILAQEPTSCSIEETPIESSIHRQIIDILDTRVRPAVAGDGGDIVFHSFNDGIVYLQMRGACAGCPSSTETLKMGIENLLKYYVPEVKEVRQIND